MGNLCSEEAAADKVKLAPAPVVDALPAAPEKKADVTVLSTAEEIKAHPDSLFFLNCVEQFRAIYDSYIPPEESFSINLHTYQGSKDSEKLTQPVSIQTLREKKNNSVHINFRYWSTFIDNVIKASLSRTNVKSSVLQDVISLLISFKNSPIITLDKLIKLKQALYSLQDYHLNSQATLVKMNVTYLKMKKKDPFFVSTIKKEGFYGIAGSKDEKVAMLPAPLPLPRPPGFFARFSGDTNIQYAQYAQKLQEYYIDQVHHTTYAIFKEFQRIICQLLNNKIDTIEYKPIADIFFPEEPPSNIPIALWLRNVLKAVNEQVINFKKTIPSTLNTDEMYGLRNEIVKDLDEIARHLYCYLEYCSFETFDKRATHINELNKILTAMVTTIKTCVALQKTRLKAENNPLQIVEEIPRNLVSGKQQLLKDEQSYNQDEIKKLIAASRMYKGEEACQKHSFSIGASSNAYSYLAGMGPGSPHGQEDAAFATPLNDMKNVPHEETWLFIAELIIQLIQKIRSELIKEGDHSGAAALISLIRKNAKGNRDSYNISWGDVDGMVIVKNSDGTHTVTYSTVIQNVENLEERAIIKSAGGTVDEHHIGLYGRLLALTSALGDINVGVTQDTAGFRSLPRATYLADLPPDTMHVSTSDGARANNPQVVGRVVKDMLLDPSHTLEENTERVIKLIKYISSLERNKKDDASILVTPLTKDTADNIMAVHMDGHAGIGTVNKVSRYLLELAEALAKRWDKKFADSLRRKYSSCERKEEKKVAVVSGSRNSTFSAGEKAAKKTAAAPPPTPSAMPVRGLAPL